MSQPPSGTVTFLFTDVEGSTKLAQQYPDRWETLRSRHHTLLHQAMQSHHGYVFQIIGDAFCVAFSTAADALNAAILAQRLLHQEPWDPVSIHVRIGISTGTAHAAAVDDRSGGYTGFTSLARVQRVMALAHSGQTLLSQSTHDLVRDTLPADVSLRDLGEHRLKDLQQPEHLYQLDASGLPTEFPPLPSVDAFPNNLPVQLTSFVGREREMGEVKRLFAGTHLLTLTGIGGTGKTRLALQAAADLIENFPDGVWLVELASITDPALTVQAIASALAVKERQQQSIQQTLVDYLKPRKLLLLLDNCEHLVEVCAKIADALLRACPDLKILASSREGLGIDGETTMHVPSLLAPDPKHLPPLDTLAQFDAVRLFCDRARAGSTAFTLTAANVQSIAQICYRLDGIPLAIELAAARVKALKVEEIAARLDDRFRLLTGGSRTALPRHQTLRALMDWSWDLLSASEHLFLRRLAIFAGGWSLPAAEAVCADNAQSIGGLTLSPSEILDLLTHLVEKSLVFADEHGEETRYQIHETVRQYALAKLIESGETEIIRTRHLEFMTAFAERAEPALTGVEQTRWLNHVEIEHDNLRAALDWSQQADANAEVGLRLAGTLARFWITRGYLQEGRERITRALEHAKASPRDDWRAQALNGAAMLSYRQSDYAATRTFAEQALAIFRQRGDKGGVADALYVLGNVATEEGDYTNAPGLFEEGLALYRELRHARGTAVGLINLGWAALRPGNYALAQSRLEEALGLYRHMGDENGTALALSGLGEVAVREGKLDQATQRIESSLALRKKIGDKWGIGVSLGTWAWIAMRQRDWTAAADRLCESITVRQEIGDKGGIAWCLERLAEVALETNSDERAVSIFGAASTLRASMGSIIDPADQPAYEKNIAALRDRLGEYNFTAAWSLGSGMTMEQAIDFALGEKHEPTF